MQKEVEKLENFRLLWEFFVKVSSHVLPSLEMCVLAQWEPGALSPHA